VQGRKETLASPGFTTRPAQDQLQSRSASFLYGKSRNVRDFPLAPRDCVARGEINGFWHEEKTRGAGGEKNILFRSYAKAATPPRRVPGRQAYPKAQTSPTGGREQDMRDGLAPIGETKAKTTPAEKSCVCKFFKLNQIEPTKNEIIPPSPDTNKGEQQLRMKKEEMGK